MVGYNFLVFSLLFVLVCTQYHEVCVDPVNGDDNTCQSNEPSAQCLNPCKTLQKGINMATLRGDHVKVLPGQFIGNFTVDHAVSLYGQATDSTQWPAISGSLKYVGDLTTLGDVAIELKNFTFLFDGLSSPVNFANSVFSLVNLNILVVHDNNNATSNINLVDFSNTTKKSKTGTCVWSVDFTSELVDWQAQSLFYVSNVNSNDLGSNVDFQITTTLGADVIPNATFFGYNVNLSMPTGSPNDDPLPQSVISISNANNSAVNINVNYPTLILSFSYTTFTQVSARQLSGIKLLHVEDMLISGAQISGQISAQDAARLNMQNVANGSINLAADWTSYEVLSEVLIKTNNAFIEILETSGAPVQNVSVFSVEVHDSDFSSFSNNQAAIVNPYGSVWVGAQRNYFGPSGPTVACNPQGAGPILGDNIVFNAWCLDAKCTTFSTSDCGSLNTTTTSSTTGPAPTPTNTTGGPTPSPPGMSPGGVAGLIIGLLLSFALIGGGVYYFKFRKTDYQQL